MRLLIVEDEIAIAQPLKLALEKRNFAVDIAITGPLGLSKARENDYDCLILDLNLPDIDGLEIAKRLRAEGSLVPILMLTARTSQQNIYDGFEAGTDDYLVKPFDFKELLYRIQSLLKKNTPTANTLLTAYNITLDTRTLKVSKEGQDISLNAKEVGILEYLLRNKGKVVNQEELLEHVWNESIDMLTQTVRTNIKTLRKKIDPEKKIIKTFKGKGYVVE